MLSDDVSCSMIDLGSFVKFDGVEKSYDGERFAVTNLNLSIEKGEFLTLLGPSGSGKTTSLMMLAGFEDPTAGDIRVGGRSLRSVPPYRRGIGMVFQNYALFPHMTVEENIAFPLSVRKIAKSEIGDRVSNALDLVRLGGYGGRRPAELSGGQQQRIALARALVFEPKLVLMDEPLGALDKQLREQLQIEIKHIQKSLQITVIYVTHDQSEALTMSDRIAVFNNGMVQELATPTELYERPQSAFVAQFVGESNQVPGTVVERRCGYCVVETNEGLLIESLDVGVGPVGSRAILSFRPEKVLVQPADDRCSNRFDAKIVDLIYYGDHTKIQVKLSNNSDIVLRLMNSDRPISLSNGDIIKIGWSRDDCRAFLEL